MVRKQTCSVSHLNTDGDLAMFLQTEAGDSPGQQASVRPDELTEQQDIRVVVFVLQVPSVYRTFGFRVRRLWSLWSVQYVSLNYCGFTLLLLHHLTEASALDGYSR